MTQQYLKLKNYSDVPPNEFYWIDPTTKVEMRSGDIEMLFEIARSHRRVNKLEIPDDYNAFIEDAICRRAPANFVRPVPGLESSHIVVSQAVKKTDALMRAAAKNGGVLLCDISEALARSIICMSCPQNAKIMCQSCNGVLDWMRVNWQLPKLPSDSKLETCRVTKVMNKAQVHLHPDVIRQLVSSEAATIFPQSCWKRKLLTPETSHDHNELNPF